METKSVEITAAEGGWALKLGGVTTSILPTYELALAAANEAQPQDPSAVAWIRGTDGAVKPQPVDKETHPSSANSTKPDSASPASEVVVAEHIAVPANIHGEDMRDLQNKGSQ